MDTIAPTRLAMSRLAAALAADPAALAVGAPPLAGRLAAELIARGSTALAPPACAVCGRTGRPLFARHRRRGVPAVPELAASRRLRELRQGQAGLWPGHGRPACVRGVPPPRPGPAPDMRELRENRACRHPRPRRQAGHLRELLPAPGSGLQRMRPHPALHICRHLPARLQAVRPAAHRGLRPLRPGPPAASPLGGRPGLRHLLHHRAAPPHPVRVLRTGTAAGQPARPGRRHLRQLRRAARHQRMR